MHTKSWLRLLTCLLLSSLSTSLSARAAARLSEAEALVRSAQVKDVRYQLDLDIAADRDDFGGWVRSSFQFKAQGQDLRVDFAEGSVQEVLVNDKKVSFRYDQEALYLAETLFRSGAQNTLAIRFQHPFSKDGDGFYRYRDSSDGQVYVYTHFEPYAANRFIPCFDQPDLKARFTLKVKAPKSWTVVSSLRESSVQTEGQKQLWNFPETLPFSTYLFALHAGPFRVWEDKRFRYPLRVMSRQSLAERVPAKEWLDVTRRGFDYYDQYLGTPYPFTKYDQVAVPDFNAGAMENIAAVTFSERFLVSGHRTQSQKEGLAGTILHEMAHMWFGDLVTMRWWNDLWLNESFATYGSTLAMASFAEFPDEWLGFARSKTGAYLADAAITTHPIVATVPDTETAESNFDGITYAKGASFLHLLHFVVGEKAFQEGLQLYFRKHSFGNTVVGDLIAAMETTAQRSLQDFTKSWLKTAGPNIVSVQSRCENGKIADFRVLQTAEARTPELREHKALFGFYRADAEGSPQLFERKEIAYQGPFTPWSGAQGMVCPDLIVPNLDEHDYAKVRFDPASLSFARRKLHRIKDRGVRMQIWNSLGYQVEAAELSLSEYVTFFDQQFAKEADYQVLRAIEGVQQRAFLAFVSAMPDQTQQKLLLDKVASQYDKRLQSGELERDSKLLLFPNYLTVLTKAKRTDTLLALYRGVISYPGLPLEQEKRWDLVQALSDLHYPDIAKLVRAEKGRDKSTLAQRQVLAARASSAAYQEKMAMLRPIVEARSKLSAADRVAILSNLFPESQASERLSYQSTLAKEVDGVVARLEPAVARAYVMNLLSLDCPQAAPTLLQELLAKPFSEGLHKSLLLADESHQRCRAVVN